METAVISGCTRAATIGPAGVVSHQPMVLR